MEVVLRGVRGLPELEGFLEVPPHAAGVVLFAHGSGSSRHSPRNNYVARELRRSGLATLLVDLLTEEEDVDYARRFEIGLLTQRLRGALAWLGEEPATRELPVGLFGASTGAAAALQLAALAPKHVRAVVSRGGRPDLAGEEALARVRAPTLLVVGGDDSGVIELNESAYERLRCEKDMAIVPGATHLFEEPGALEHVAHLAVDWFTRHLAVGNDADKRR
ncbi:MAG TPA: alpha/beta family hydrolase [Usitatibacter sp.]|nr:alpha/beta family hydrolase [Usitatibacter sp.]